MERIENHMVRPIRYRVVKCPNCNNEGKVKLLKGMEEVIEDCSICGGEGSFEKEVLTASSLWMRK